MNKIDNLKRLNELHERAKEEGALFNKHVLNNLRIMRSFIHDPGIVNEYAQKTGSLLDILLIANPPGLFKRLSGDRKIVNGIHVGQLDGSHGVFDLSLEEINQNLLILGRAGAGKTVCILGMASQLMSQGVPCWYLDFKQDYRILLNHFPGLLVVRPMSLKLNFLEAPGPVDPYSWLQVVTDVIVEKLEISQSSKFLLVDCIDDLYKQYGIYEGTKCFPTMHDLHELILDKLQRKNTHVYERNMLFTCAGRIKVLLKRLGSMLDCSRGYSLEKLLNRNVVFELTGLSSELQSLIANVLLCWIFNYRIALGERGRLRNIAIFDEAKMLFGKEL